MSNACTSPPARRPARHCGRRLALLPGLLVAAAVACAPPQPVDLAGSNLLLITIDTLRSDRIGAFGDAQASTPHLDQLAREGVSFPNSYAHVPLTLPSHGSLFTGRYPFAIQVRNNGTYFLPQSEITLAERLQDSGYSTAAFVSSYVLASKFGLDQGFDTYDDTIETGDILQSFTSEVAANQVVDRFESWLQAESPQRFFAWLHFYDPHLPYSPPQPHLGRFAADPYRGEIAFVDSQIGRALAALGNGDRRANTLIVVTSDHGESFGEHGENGHGILTYEESLRVPLIFNAGKKLPQGVEIGQRVRLVDLFPTLLEMLGVSRPTGDETGGSGQSLQSLVAGRSEGQRRSVYFESLLGSEDYNWAPITGLISGDHKYISVPQPELYDLVRDPSERKNIHRIQPDLAAELDGELQRLLLSGGNTNAAPRRSLSEDDAEHLRALGYLGSVERSETIVDPKQGIRIDARLKQIRALAEAGSADQAAAEADALATDYADIEMAGLYALRHEIATRRGDLETAIQILRQGIEALPDSERLRFLLANALVQSGDLAEAALVSERLLEANPRFSQAWVVLGQVAEATGDFGSAVQRYDAALELEPRSLPLRRRRAEALLRTGATHQALGELAELAQTGAFADDPEQIYRTAILASQIGDSARAEQIFRLGLEASPGGVHHVTFALLLMQNGKPEEARGHLELALGRYADELAPDQRSVAESTLARLAAAAGE